MQEIVSEETDYSIMENLLEDKTCSNCTRSLISYLFCPNFLVSETKISVPKHNTCNRWTDEPIGKIHKERI